MVKFYASAKFAVDTKNDLKFIFQCGIGVYHKLNEENVMHLAGHRKTIHNIKLCKDFTEIANEKNLGKDLIQNFKRKKSFPNEQFLIEWKIILSHYVSTLECYYFLLSTYVTCVMGATLMLR